MTSFTLVIPHLPPSELFPNRLNGLTDEAKGFINRNWNTMSVKKIASAMNITVGSVRSYKYRHHLADTDRLWTDEQIAYLRDVYSDTTYELNLKNHSEILKKSAQAIQLKAAKLGLASKPGSRKRKTEDYCALRKKKLWWKSLSPDERKTQISLLRSDAIKEHGHPRGYREIRICPVCGKFFDIEHSTPNKACSIKCGVKLRSPIKQFTRCKGGKRDDLGRYFRSSWEANYARFLNFLIKNEGLIDRWEYESETFDFPNIKRGVRSYTPDFKVFYKDGHIEYHEVKGWDYQRGITARKRFNKNYPHLKLVLIDEDFFKALNRQGIKNLVPLWE